MWPEFGMRLSGEFVAGGLPSWGCEPTASAGYTSMCLRSCSSVGQVDRIGLSGRAGDRPCDGTVSYVGMAELSGRPWNV